MANITTYDESWNTHTGAEVQSFINGKLEDHETTISNLNRNAITDITFAQDDQVKSKINYTYMQNGQSKSGSFTTTVQSAYNAELELIDDLNPTAIAYGEDLVISYRYSVYNTATSKYGGFTGILKYTVNNNITHDNIPIERTYTSSTARKYTLTIPARELRSGMNTINLEVYSRPTDDSQTNIAAASLSVYALTLSLGVTTENINDFQIADDAQFAVNLGVTNNNDSIRSLDASDIHYKMFVDGVQYTTGTFNSQYTAQLQNLTLNDIQTTSSLTSYSNSVGMYFYAYATVNQKTIYSNYVYIQLIRSTAIENDNNIIVVGYKFNNVSSIGSNNIITLNRTQYGSDAFEYYVYANQQAKYSLTKYNTSTYVETTITEANTAHMTGVQSIERISINVQYDTYGTYNYNLYVDPVSTTITNPNPKVSLSINIEELVTSLIMPTGADVNLQAKNKQAGNNDSIWNLNDNSDVSCIFNNFNWTGNGWVSTSDGTALLINDDAALNIPYSICNQTNAPYAFTVSFKYKVFNGINEDEQLINCMSNNTGFTIYPKKIVFGIGNIKLLNLDMSNTHEVTLVYYGNNNSIYSNMASIYIDGKYQAIFTTGSIIRHDSSIMITSNEADIYLYSVIAYPKALSFTQVQALYCFNNKTSAEIVNYINDNNVFGTLSTTEVGSYGQRIKPENLPDGSAYMVLECDTADRAWEIINAYPKSSENKRIKHYLKSAALYVKGADGTAAQNRNFYASPAVISAQGTSSMDYPVKNYRVYFNKTADIAGYTGTGKTTAFYERVAEGTTSSIYAQDTIKGYRIFDSLYGDSSSDYPYPSAYSLRLCLKADYAESSSSHNTGFARLTNKALSESDILQDSLIAPNETGRLPQQEAQRRAAANNALNYRYDIRANIDGRPIYLFFKIQESANDATSSVYYYVGRYNMNNDKSNEDVFGFKEKGQGITLDYYNNPIVRNEGKYLQTTYATIDPHYAETHKASDDDMFINPTECWEFSANENTGSDRNGIMAAFQHPFATAFTVKNDSNELIWLNEAWEYRFPDLEGQADEYYQSGVSKPVLLYKLYDWLYAHNYTRTNQINDLQTFASELHLYFNINYLLKYYALTHWFGAVDQRIKNSMLSFYCDPYGVTESEATQSPLHYMRGYFIFYDNDTILGINNNGDQNFINWDLDEADGVFPGSPNHAIWSNLAICHQSYLNNTQGSGSAIYKLGKLINDAYVAIRKYITNSVFEKYFDETQLRYYPDAIQNVDVEIKYVYPKQINPSQEEPFGLSKAQGTREYYRDYWFGNRTYWLDDRYGAGDYDKYKLSIKPADTGSGDTSKVGGTISIKPTSYFRDWKFYLTGDTANSNTGLLANGSAGSLSYSNQSVSASINIFGLYACEEIDFSNCNWGSQGISMFGVSQYNFPYLRKLIFGNNSSENITIIPSDQLKTFLSNRLYPALQELTLQNIQNTNNGSYSLDFSEFIKLTKLSLAGVSVNDIHLPNSSTLQTLIMNCPSTLQLKNKVNIKQFELANMNALTTVVSDNNNSLINKTILNHAINGNSITKLTIKYGTDDQNYTIDTTELEYLVNLVSKSITKNVSGSIFAPDITTEQLSVLKANYPSLNIETSLSGDIKLVIDKTNVYEGDSVNVMTTNGVLGDVSDWKLFINNSTTPTTSDYFTLTANNTGSCTVSANQMQDNTSHEFTIWVGFQKSDGTYELTDPIYVHYVAIQSITLTTDSKYGLREDKCNITLTLNTNCTKQFLFNTNNINVITSSGVSYQTIVTNGLITGFELTKSAADFDTIQITHTISSISSNILSIELDAIILDLSEDNNKDSNQYWLSLYLQQISGTSVNRQYYKSDLAKLTFDWTTFNNCINYITGIEGATTQDLSKLQYFNWNSTTFSLRGSSTADFDFDNLIIPEGMTSFVWNTNLTYTNKRQITIPASIKKCVVNLSISDKAFPSNLQFDLSGNSNITSIYNAGNVISSVPDGVFSIWLIDQSQLPSGASYNVNNSLFKYNPNLTYNQIGNIINDTTTVVQALPAMFDVSATDIKFSTSNVNNSKTCKPFYFLGNPNVVNVGYFTTYFTGPSEYPIGLQSTSIQKIYRTYLRQQISSAMTLPSNLQEVGDFAFCLLATDIRGNGALTLSNSIIKIGTRAFYNVSADILNGVDGLDLTHVIFIKAQAFAGCEKLTKVKLSFNQHDLTIESEAFYSLIPTANNITPEIYLDGEDITRLTIDPTAFNVSTGYKQPIIYVNNNTIKQNLAQINSNWNIQIKE